MFGNNTASTWGNPQQNQQQQQPAGGSAFGQPNAFGNTGGAFGSTGAFGQPQQQPQANPMFGNLGGSTNSASPSGFGAFGGATNSNNNQTTSAFGAPRPATGFGAFGGGTSTFGSTPAFGSTTAPAGTSGTNLFGQPNNTTTAGAFGGNTGLFGASKPATTGFGTAPAQNQNGSNTVAAVTTGSSNPPYNAFSDKENPGNGSSVTLHYQSISCMPAYQGTSFEELRYQDYAQGRKTAGSFGQSATFGATPAQPTTSIFGQPQQSTPQPNAFGAPTTTPSTGFGAFGQPAATQTPQPSTGLFGGGAFGQPQQQQQQPAQQTNAFGAFGQPAQQSQQPVGGIFGGGTTAFGQPKPAGTGFGTFGGGTFGSSTTTTNAFGQQQQQQQQQQPATTGLFGQPQPAATNAFGAFGNTASNNAAKPLFGQPAAQPAQPAFGTGLFGQNQQQQQQQQQQPAQQQQQPSLFGGGGGLFGSTNTQANQQNPQQPAPNIFGATTAQPNAGGGLFGGGGGLFGSNQQQQQQQQNQQPTTNAFGPGGLFGKPAAPANNLFGGFGQQNTANAAQPQQNSLFGSTLGQSTNQQSSLGAGSLFGKPAAPPMGASTSNTNAALAGGLFGSFAPAGSFSATTTQGAQGTLTASIAEPIGNNLAIFSMLPPGPRSINLDPQPAKKKAGFFVDVPTRAPLPRVQLGYTPAASKLRGFASSTSNSSSGNPFSSVSFISGKAGALSLSRGDSKSPMSSDSLLRSQSPSLGSSQRQSVKKLILDKKVEPIDLFSKSGGSPARMGGSKVMFSPALSVAAREKEAAAAAAAAPSPQKAALPAPRDQRTPSRLDASKPQARNASPVTEAQKDPTALEEGDYWCKPDLDTLKGKGFQELSSFSGLVLGRKGYGEIHFLEPVDLTGLPKLGSLLGDVVRFDDKECSVYPDVDDVDKPPPGSGLNVKARLMLDRCWATDKASREPIKDEKHPSAVKHLKRLRNMKDTQFEGFDIKDGRWTFTVDHF